MKKHMSIVSCFCLFLTLFSTQCDEDIPPIDQESKKQELAILKADIENIVNTSVCNGDTECKFIAFGSKPCGGPWSYLVYSTSINIEELENMVEVYNQKEAIYNSEWGIISDCSVTNPPTSINCENNTCVAMY